MQIVKVSVVERYERIMRIFENKSDAVQKYKEELLGSATEFDYSDTFNMIGLGKELVGSYMTFKAMMEDPREIRTIAKMIAQFQLKNMVEVVQRHDTLQRQKMEKMQNKVNKANKGKK